jgi:hypothetical protein
VQVPAIVSLIAVLIGRGAARHHRRAGGDPVAAAIRLLLHEIAIRRLDTS